MKKEETLFAGKTLSIETGRLAGQANGSVTVRYGDTLILATAVITEKPRPGIDFLPLLVDYEERFYAAGKISGSRFVKREGRPSEFAILNARMIDRAIRPLFPKDFRNDVQVVITVLSIDNENDPSILGMIGASAALMMAGAPIESPVAAVRIGLNNDEIILNPNMSQFSETRLNLVAAASDKAVLMIEAGAKGKTMDNIPGVAFCHSGKVIVNPADGSCFPEKLDDLAMPAWEKLPFEKYGRIASPHGVDLSANKFRYAPMMTSRGCRFQCAYCHISREKEGISGRIGRLRCHSIDRVIKETEKLKSLGVEKLFMEDDSLLSDKERMKLIIGYFERMGLNLANVNGVNIVDFFNKENDEYKVDKNFVEILKQAGFEQIVFPVESGSQRILKKYATNKVLLDRMDVVGLMKDISDHKILAPVNMMIGFPDEDEKEIQESIDLAKKLRDAGAPYVTFFIPIPFPGSKLYDIAIAGGHLEQNFNPDLLNWKRAVMKNTKVSPERIEEIRDRANEEVNSEDHLRKRLEDSVGFRWTSGNQNQK